MDYQQRVPEDLKNFRDGSVLDLTPKERAVLSVAVIVLILFLNWTGAL